MAHPEIFYGIDPIDNCEPMWEGFGFASNEELMLSLLDKTGYVNLHNQL